ncbi:MAG: hypothetical protein KDC80_12435 [Saprospiraceae bacterium]|nr:hypothetical protein [Saprospiraceae bacterium]
MNEVSVWFYLLLVCLPALIVFATCYLVIRQFFRNKEQLELLAIQKNTSASVLPLKLQAYERLILFFERIHIPGLVAKVRTRKMSSGDLHSALMIAIQQEFEHNVTQQMYISDQLWEIVRLAKQELFNQMDHVMVSTSFSEDADTFSRALVEHFANPEFDPTRKAIHALKQEAKLLL